MAKRLTLYITLALVLGIVAGLGLHAFADPAAITTITDFLSILTSLFLRLIKMIIAPLVFATLVAGIAHFDDASALGRIGLRAVLWFVAASLVSLTLGLVLVNLIQPGLGVGLSLPAANATSGVEIPPFDFRKFVLDIVPTSIVEAMADNKILPIVFFSIFFGVALAAVGEKGRPLVKVVEGVMDVMLVVTNYVMRTAPIAVFAAVTSVFARQGIGILGTYAWFIGGFFLGLALLWGLLLGVAVLIVGGRARLLVRYIREPLLIGFSTASSEAAFPRTLEALVRFGVPPRIASFVLPLGYSFNLDGSMMFMTFASIFIAQAYGIDLTLGQEIVMLLTLMVTSKGMAAVPRASMVVIAATLAQFNIPEAGLLLILGIDHFLDMGRTATNVVGNAVASVVVARWEGPLGPLRPPEGQDESASTVAALVDPVPASPPRL